LVFNSSASALLGRVKAETIFESCRDVLFCSVRGSLNLKPTKEYEREVKWDMPDIERMQKESTYKRFKYYKHVFYAISVVECLSDNVSIF